MSTGFCRDPRRSFKPQNGMVLLLGLIFLTALTLLGLSASADAILQNKLASNLQETERAKQSALTALSWAENWLLELEGTAPETCLESCAGLYLHAIGDLPSHPEFESFTWWMNQGHEAGIDPLTGERSATISSDSFNTAVWIIEELHSIAASEDGTVGLQVWYRILARGSGRSSAGVSVIESTVLRSWSSTENTESTGHCPGSGPTAECGRFAWRELR